LRLERILILEKLFVSRIFSLGLITEGFARIRIGPTPTVLTRIERFTGVRVTSLLEID
jgi:hypothetical protein